VWELLAAFVPYDTYQNEGFWYLHHEHQFIVGEVVIVNGDPPDILTQRRLDDQLSRQVQLVERFFHFFFPRSQSVNTADSVPV
jgi:hypothetical protein